MGHHCGPKFVVITSSGSNKDGQIEAMQIIERVFFGVKSGVRASNTFHIGTCRSVLAARVGPDPRCSPDTFCFNRALMSLRISIPLPDPALVAYFCEAVA